MSCKCIIKKLRRNPEKMDRNYHAVTNEDFLCHFALIYKPNLSAAANPLITRTGFELLITMFWSTGENASFLFSTYTEVKRNSIISD